MKGDAVNNYARLTGISQKRLRHTGMYGHAVMSPESGWFVTVQPDYMFVHVCVWVPCYMGLVLLGKRPEGRVAC